MIRPGFLTSLDRRKLVACVCSHREDQGVARRANAILFLDDGESCVQIAKFLCLDDDTVRGWYKTYREGGWDAISTDAWRGSQSRMTSAQETKLCVWLDERFFRSTVEIRAPFVEQTTVVVLSAMQRPAKIEACNPYKEIGTGPQVARSAERVCHDHIRNQKVLELES